MKLAVGLLLAMVSPVVAADVDIRIDNFSSDEWMSRAVIKVTNNSGQNLTNVFIDCTFLDGEKRALDIGKVLIPSLAAGAYAYDKAAIQTTGKEKFVECMVRG